MDEELFGYYLYYIGGKRNKPMIIEIKESGEKQYRLVVYLDRPDIEQSDTSIVNIRNCVDAGIIVKISEEEYLGFQFGLL